MKTASWQDQHGTTRDLAVSCPYCGKAHDAHSPVSANADHPVEGAVSLCFDCAEPGIYTSALTLRRPSDDERAKLLAHPQVRAVRSAIQMSMALYKAMGSTDE